MLSMNCERLALGMTKLAGAWPSVTAARLIVCTWDQQEKPIVELRRAYQEEQFPGFADLIISLSPAMGFSPPGSTAARPTSPCASRQGPLR